ncbi:unnamed protein product [Linum tenue]|uniref:Coatomer subunit delta n=1 Tax=Linum tenue TaxID=586396 RepID=A0AAV0I4X0_9ROSI|nr:unnamed protein product [Linum tenue]
MVVLAASIVTKSGKVLVSRQFVDMSRIRIEGLLAAFPKLVGTGKQHTYVETENVRYVYQPIELMYLLLVTNKQSNILEDLETLRLLSKLVPEYAMSLDEEGICKTAFELIFAFDEVISLGHKDNVTVAQVKQYCEMESHEEKLHKLVMQSKINETKDVMKRKASEIDKSKVSAEVFELHPSTFYWKRLTLLQVKVLITSFISFSLKRIGARREGSCHYNQWALEESRVASMI